MQTSNEEFRASIEQLHATNEQLHATNERLETSKHRIESMNGRLSTLNAELQLKMTELRRVNDDMTSLMAGMVIGTILVDREMCIRRYSFGVTQFIKLVQTDIGRSLRHILAGLVGYDGLLQDVHSVLDSQTPARIGVDTQSGARYYWQVRPHLTAGDVLEGAVVTFSQTKSIEGEPVTPLASVGFGSARWARKQRGIDN